MHTTNYMNTLIESADDCPVSEGHIPPEKKEKTLASLQYDLLIKNPYQYTSDDLIFKCYMIKSINLENNKDERERFFSKGQPCLHSSPLAKRYGFGFHHNQESKVALFSIDSEEYKDLIQDDSVKKVKAMRSTRK